MKTKITKINGSRNKKIKFFIIKAQNWAKIPIKVCPANILAKSRIDKLKCLITKEKTSVKIMKSNKILGTPLGTKNEKKRKP